MASFESRSSIAALCNSQIKPTINAIEGELNLEKADIYWETVKTSMSFSLSDKLLVALVYKYYFHKRPNNFISLAETVTHSGISDIKRLKTLYKSAKSYSERLKILDRIPNEDLDCFIVTMVKSDNLRISRDEVIKVVNKNCDMCNLQKGVQLLDLEESFEEEDAIPYWRKESLKLYNTINSVLNGMKIEEPSKKFILDLKENQTRLKGLLQTISGEEGGLDEDVLWSSWLECIATSFNNPDYLTLKGLNYSLFKNMANRALAIKENSGY